MEKLNWEVELRALSASNGTVRHMQWIGPSGSFPSTANRASDAGPAWTDLVSDLKKDGRDELG